MHVEIHHGNAGEPMPLQRMFRGNRDIAEQTEPHLHRGLRVMSRRAHRGKGIRGLPAQHHIHGPRHGAHTPERRSNGTR